MFLSAPLFHVSLPYKCIVLTMWFNKSESQNAIEPLSLLFLYELEGLKCSAPLACFCHVQERKRVLPSVDREGETVYL